MSDLFGPAGWIPAFALMAISLVLFLRPSHRERHLLRFFILMPVLCLVMVPLASLICNFGSLSMIPCGIVVGTSTAILLSTPKPNPLLPWPWSTTTAALLTCLIVG